VSALLTSLILTVAGLAMAQSHYLKITKAARARCRSIGALIGRSGRFCQLSRQL
jgi:predicted lysophospholipase L1 biosynthesis ABC-type transport system permease subunit